jgi:hypothetical protein
VPAAKMFPYVINEGTELPAIVYTIDTIGAVYNKSGWCNDEITFSVYSASKSYTQLQTIVSAIRGALEYKYTGSGSQDINYIYLNSFEEDHDGIDTFYNRLNFKVIVNKY